MRTLLYEAANAMLTRYKGQLELKDWAFAIAKRLTMRKAKVALARRLAIIMHDAARRDGVRAALGLAIHETGGSQEERRPRERVDDGADCVAGANR